MNELIIIRHVRLRPPPRRRRRLPLLLLLLRGRRVGRQLPEVPGGGHGGVQPHVSRRDGIPAEPKVSGEYELSGILNGA